MTDLTAAESYASALEDIEHGRFAQAEAVLKAWLSRHPGDATARAQLAKTFLLDRQLDKAAVALAGAMAVDPAAPGVRLTQARLLLRQNRPAEGLEAAVAVWTADGGQAESSVVLAAALSATGQTDRALGMVEAAMALRGDYADAYALRAQLNARRGAAGPALADAERAIALKPHLTQLWPMIGALRHKLGDLDGAIQALESAVEHEPPSPHTLINLGEFRRQADRLDGAVEALRQATALAPDNALAWINLGVALQQGGRKEEAKAAYGRASERAAHPQVHNNLGSMLRDEGALSDAEVQFRRALEIDPVFAEAHAGLGVVLHELGRLEAAEVSSRRALELNPGLVEASNNLGTTLLSFGRFAEAEGHLQDALKARPDFAKAHSNLLFLRQHLTGPTPGERLEEAREFGAMARRGVRERFASWPCDPEPKRLRVGFVSGDLHDHVVGFFIENIVRQLDPARVELFAYPTRNKQTALTERIRPHFSAWRPLSGLDDEAAARLIHSDGLHVLIDLSGHTGFNRLPIFAWKPAPVQATWVGYFATTGVEEIDYIITDKYLIPPGDEDQFTETPWRLSGAGCLTPPDYPIQPNGPPVFTEGVFTFGCFNNLRKVTDEVVALWSRILLAAPTSRLFLKAQQLDEPSVREATLRRFADHGVPADRLLLEGPSKRGEYLQAYHRVDAALDPFPYPGATTSIEGLWMGVPVITRRGDRLLSRVGESIAHRASLSDWVAEDDEEYVAMALALVADPAPLVELRAGLRQQVLASLLYDGAGFARELEDALWEMWCKWRDGSVEPSSQNAEAHFHRGNMMKTLKRLDEAEASYRRALELQPNSVATRINLGNLLQGQGQSRWDEAEENFRHAIAVKPGMAEAHNNLGSLLFNRGQIDAAKESFGRALELRPDYPTALQNLGKAFLIQDRLEEAVAKLRRALELDPNLSEAHTSLGIALYNAFRFEEAEASYRKALALDPGALEVHNNLGSTLVLQGRFAEAEASFLKAAEAAPDAPSPYSNLLFLRQHLSRYTAAERLDEARRFGEMVRAKVTERYSSWTCPPEPTRLRVGFVSGDLYDHVVGHFLEGILRELDSERIELFAYVTRARESDLTQRIKPLFSAWRSLVGLEDEEAAELIHSDGLHVLIDLSGHTGFNRLPIFAWKPAPVQATWVGYFATTGVEEIDYIISDKYLIPPEDEDQYTETPWRLPNSACLTPPKYPVEPNAPPVLSEGVFTFGCFNNLRKVTDEVVALWSRILLAAPGSRLFLKAPQLGEPSVREATLRRFAAHGVPADRLLLEGPSPRGEYLKAYHRVDVVLDPFPYPGATTSIEGLWMGVPVITRRGDRLLSRVGEATAQRAGLADWIAADDDAYVAMALRLVADPAPLVELRGDLRQQVLASSLYDGAGFARDLEEALWGMWRRYADAPGHGR